MAKRRGHRTHYVRVPTISFIALILAVAGLTILLWSAERGTDARLNVKNPGDLNALLPSIIGLTESSMDAGNRIRVLQNGDQFFARRMDQEQWDKFLKAAKVTKKYW